MGRIIKGIDIREYGSGNAGGTNAFRILGWKPALVVVVVDVLKGWFPVAILAPMFFEFQNIPDLGVVQILCGFVAVLGHTYTIFGGFKGGKGVGTLGGMMIALFPMVFPFCLANGLCFSCFNNCFMLITDSTSFTSSLFRFAPSFSINYGI